MRLCSFPVWLRPSCILRDYFLQQYSPRRVALRLSNDRNLVGPAMRPSNTTEHYSQGGKLPNVARAGEAVLHPVAGTMANHRGGWGGHGATDWRVSQVTCTQGAVT